MIISYVQQNVAFKI